MTVEIVATGDALTPWALVVDGETVDYESMEWGHDTGRGGIVADVDFGGGRTAHYEGVTVRPELAGER